MDGKIYSLFVFDGYGQMHELQLEDIDIATIFNLEDLLDVESRNDFGTKEFTLKGTKHNNMVIGHMFDLSKNYETGNEDFYGYSPDYLHAYTPNKFLDAILFENNVQILKGSFVVKNVSKNGNDIIYGCMLVGKVVSFFKDIQDRYLHELDSLKQDVSFSNENIINSWTANNFNTKYINTAQPNILKDSKMENYTHYGSPAVGSTLTSTSTESTKAYKVTIDNAIGTVYGLQAGVSNRNVSITNGEVLTISYKMRGNIPTMNYGYIMRTSGGTNSASLVQSLPNLSTTEWKTYTRTFNAPFTSSVAYVMLSYRNVEGGGNRWFEIKDIKLERGGFATPFSYNPEEFKYTPYIIPQLDYGEDDRVDYDGNMEGERIIINYWDKEYDFKNFRPAIYLKAYIDAIFKGFVIDNDTGFASQFSDGQMLNKYGYDCELFNSKNFNKIFIPYNEESFKRTSNGTWCTITMSDVDGAGIFNGAEAMAFKPQNFTFSSDFFRNGKYAKFVPKKGFLEFRQTDVPYIRPIDNTIKSTLRMKMQLRLNSDTIGKVTVGLIDAKNGGDITIDSFVCSYTHNKTDNIEEVHTIDVMVPKPFEINGEYVMAIIKEGGNPALVFNASNISLEWGYDSSTDLPINKYDTIDLFRYIPKEVKITEFLQSIMTMFNLIMVQNPDIENMYTIKTYNEFYKDIISMDLTNVVDWSEKVDYSKYKMDTNINLPKSYLYTFEEDSDMMNERYKYLYNTTYGSYRYINRKTDVNEKEIKLLFSPTLNLNHSQNSKSLPCLFKADNWLEGKKKPMKTNLRLLFNNGVVTSPEYEWHFRTHPTRLMTKYNYCSMFSIGSNNLVDDSLVFSEPRDFKPDSYIEYGLDYNLSLFAKYHENQIIHITDPNLMVLEINAYLNENDISELNFQKPIYLENKDGNSLWKLLELNYKNSLTPARIKLQKITI
ncbi:hypothetical protein [Sphingobacterium sp.]|uniref:hypothetical protein n=1 Tax=Sphingobacterium sp. TaxID=341027 RepID=UPI0028AF2295|nr:hypothetical protein [Sphingobacterium sp.]